jgi:glycosyltransferase involved in cell wall biosynthesis
MLFPGSFQWHQGLDIAIEAFARVRTKVPNAEFHIYGGGSTERDLVALAQRLGLNGSVSFRRGVPLERIAEVIANADLGVVPKRADSFGNEAYSTKIMEFMSQGVPVVASRTKIDTFYFDEKLVHFFASGDSQAMARAILDVIEDHDLRQNLIARGCEYAEHHGWRRNKTRYLQLVDSLSTESFADCQSSVTVKSSNEHQPALPGSFAENRDRARKEISFSD